MGAPGGAAGERAAADERRRPLVVALVALLAVLGAVYFAWPAWRAGFLIEIDQNEAWNAHWAAMARAGQPIYADIHTLIANNYPPLSFLLIGFLTRFGLDPVIAGRALSLVATLVASAGIGACVRLLAGSGLAALVAALWFFATLSRFYSDYVGMDDPHLPGLAVMIWATAWMLAAHRRGRPVEPAFVLMAVAGFYKHTLIAAPLSAFLWLLLVDRRAAIRAGLAGALVGAVGLALCIGFYGQPFIDQLTAPRVQTIERALGSLGRLQWIAPGLVIAVIAAWLDRSRAEARLVLIYLAIAFVANFMMQTGQGIANNAQLELATAASLGIGLAFDRLARATSLSLPAMRIAILTILILRLLISLRGEPYLLLADASFREVVRDTDAVAAAEAARVAAMPDGVACTIPMVCYRAGKPYVYDLFSMQQQVSTGQASAAELQGRLADAHVVMATIDPRASLQRIRDAADLRRVIAGETP